MVKAFNTSFAGTLVAGEVAGQQLDVLIVGDDDEAKGSQLVSDAGLRLVDVGPLGRAQQLERLGLLHISLCDDAEAPHLWRSSPLRVKSLPVTPSLPMR